MTIRKLLGVQKKYTQLARELGAVPLDKPTIDFLNEFVPGHKGERKSIARTLLTTPEPERARIVDSVRKYDQDVTARNRTSYLRRGMRYAHPWADDFHFDRFADLIGSLSPRAFEALRPLLVDSASGQNFFGHYGSHEFKQAISGHTDERIVACLEAARNYVQVVSDMGFIAGVDIGSHSRDGCILASFLQLACLPPTLDLARHTQTTLYALDRLQEVRAPTYTYGYAFQTVVPLLTPWRLAEALHENGIEPPLPGGGQPGVDLGAHAPVGPARLGLVERRLLNDRQNVHQASRIASAERGEDGLADALSFPRDSAAKENKTLAELESLLRDIEKAGRTAGPEWMWRPRAGARSEVANARQAAFGSHRWNDFTGPIAKNDPMRRLLALVWEAIEQYGTRPGHEADVAKAQELMRNQLIKALAECIEDSGERICNVGIRQRLITTLQGYYPEVALDALVSPENLLSEIAAKFVKENGSNVTAHSFANFERRATEVAVSHFGENSPNVRTFVQHLRTWAEHDLEVDAAAQPEAFVAELFETFSRAHPRAAAADITEFRRHTREQISKQWAVQSPPWREACALVATRLAEGVS